MPFDHGRVPEPVDGGAPSDLGYEELEQEERIGAGGDADVYRATVESGGEVYTVALKTPRFEGTISKQVVEQFENEAETWARLDEHDNIVTVYGKGIEPIPWIALEYMDGGTLEGKLGNVDVEEALWLSGRIADGVYHGHRHGVAHLDIKPTNVLLRETGAGTWDYPKVSDWGLAKMLLEHSNSIEGLSPQYAAPEQFDTDEYGSPDDITDIYQLGVVVYALLTGEPPFTGSSAAVMRGVLDEEPTPPSEMNSEVPTEVDELVMKALEKEKDERYESSVTLRKKLDRLFEMRTSDVTSSTDIEDSGVYRSANQRRESNTQTISEEYNVSDDISATDEDFLKEAGFVTEDNNLSESISAADENFLKEADIITAENEASNSSSGSENPEDRQESDSSIATGIGVLLLVIGGALIIRANSATQGVSGVMNSLTGQANMYAQLGKLGLVIVIVGIIMILS